MANIVASTRDFYITVLGRTLEHLGVQMYKRRDVAIAELVANCWDADAHNVWIEVPEGTEYSQEGSTISLTDDGTGMSAEQIQQQYLVVGRNRRSDIKNVTTTRPVMGRKGIGKLAGFGLASIVCVDTWRDGASTRFELAAEVLKADAGITADVPITGYLGAVPGDVKTDSGTRLVLRGLKHKTAVDVDGLHEALGRRFSRTVRGSMRIFVNGLQVADPVIELEKRVPADEEVGHISEKLSDGTEVRFCYGFAKNVIHSAQMRGFTIYVRGKTAQAPPFFFFVEATASKQFGTRYLTGTIEADFLDDGIDDESDKVSTDRQEIDWEDESLAVFRQWGAELTRKALRERGEVAFTVIQRQIDEDDALSLRIKRLDEPSQRQIWKFLRQLADAEAVQERASGLMDALVRVYEYRHFHDVVSRIEEVGDDPDQLSLLVTCLTDWKVLESRAILEIVKGRLDIIAKFHSMIVNNAAETAGRKGDDNMHDLLAGYPWLLNPEWQVLAEEKTISKQLREWNLADTSDEGESELRYDFLALTGENQLVIVEIKRSGHPVQFVELQRLETYGEKLRKAHSDVYLMMVCGGNLDVSESVRDVWRKRLDGDIVSWDAVFEHTKRYYDHYRAVLEGEVDHDDFSKKEREVARTREVLSRDSVYRGPAERKTGLGPQDVSHEGTREFTPDLMQGPEQR